MPRLETSMQGLMRRLRDMPSSWRRRNEAHPDDLDVLYDQWDSQGRPGGRFESWIESGEAGSWHVGPDAWDAWYRSRSRSAQPTGRPIHEVLGVARRAPRR